MATTRIATRVAALLWGAAVAYGCAVASDGDESDPSCGVGSEGCRCTDGGGCDPPLACLSGFCVDTQGAGGSNASAGAGSSSAAAGGASTGSGASGSGGASTGSGTSSSSAASSGSGGSSCAVPDPASATGCTDCDNCDWTVSWASVATATHYKVAFLCGVMHESPDITATNTELCFGAGMCSYCSGGVSGVWIKACDATCCSAGTLIDVAEAPLACGGDCCL